MGSNALLGAATNGARVLSEETGLAPKRSRGADANSEGLCCAKTGMARTIGQAFSACNADGKAMIETAHALAENAMPPRPVPAAGIPRVSIC
jgi:hypothetical protein